MCQVKLYFWPYPRTLVYSHSCPYIGHPLDIDLLPPWKHGNGPDDHRHIVEHARGQEPSRSSREALLPLNGGGRSSRLPWPRKRGSPAGAGKWVLRCYVKANRAYEVETLAAADDFSDADGVGILNFKQAQEKARERIVVRARSRRRQQRTLYRLTKLSTPTLDWLGTEGRPPRPIEDAKGRAKASSSARSSATRKSAS